MTPYEKAKHSQHGHMRAAKQSKKWHPVQYRHYVSRALFYRNLARQLKEV